MSIGIHAALKPERGIRTQTVPTCALADTCGVEIGTFQEHILRCLIRARPFAAKHAGDTHRFLCVTDGQIIARQLVLHAIKGYKGRALGQCLYHHASALDHIGIKAVQGLSIGHHDIVRDVYDIINRSYAHSVQSALQPFGRRSYLAALQRHGAIARTTLPVLHDYINGQCVTIHGKGIHRGEVQVCLITIAYQPGIQVARHTVV